MNPFDNMNEKKEEKESYQIRLDRMVAAIYPTLLNDEIRRLAMDNSKIDRLDPSSSAVYTDAIYRAGDLITDIDIYIKERKISMQEERKIR